MGLIPHEELGNADTNGNAVRVPAPVTHYLLNFTGQGEPAHQGQLAHEIGKALAACGVDLLMATTYISHLAIDPRTVGIKDTWMKISDGDKLELLAKFPHLCTAIDLICGLTTREG